MIKGTVALPVYNSKKIAWLAMESLCSMIKPRDQWELIIYEEKHDAQLGSMFFSKYKERLNAVGCLHAKYLTLENKRPLSRKWIEIAEVACDTSDYFCLCAVDNYYSPYMLVEAELNIQKYDWIAVPRGYFYDFNYDRVLRYEWPAPAGLQMTARTSLVRRFPMDVVEKGVDTWFQSNIKTNKMIDYSSDHWTQILCTNGFNNISIERSEYFKDPLPPFYETDVQLNEIVPEKIAKRIKKLSQWLRSQ